MLAGHSARNCGIQATGYGKITIQTEPKGLKRAFFPLPCLMRREALHCVVPFSW